MAPSKGDCSLGQPGSIKVGAQVAEVIEWPLPGQFINVGHDRRCRVQRSQVAIQEHFVTMFDQGGTQCRRAPNRNVPVFGVGRDGLQMPIAGQQDGRGLNPPPG